MLTFQRQKVTRFGTEGVYQYHLHVIIFNCCIANVIRILVVVVGGKGKETSGGWCQFWIWMSCIFKLPQREYVVAHVLFVELGGYLICLVWTFCWLGDFHIDIYFQVIWGSSGFLLSSRTGWLLFCTKWQAISWQLD